MFLTSPGMFTAVKFFSFPTYSFNSSKVSSWVKWLCSSNAVSASEQTTIQPQYSPSSLFPQMWFPFLLSFFIYQRFFQALSKTVKLKEKLGFFSPLHFLLPLFTPEHIPVFWEGEQGTRYKLRFQLKMF